MNKYFSSKRKMTRSLISGITALCLALSIFVVPIFAEGAEPSELPLNYSGRYYEKFSISGNTLKLGGIPNSPEYNYIYFRIRNYAEEVVFKNISPRGADGSISYDISAVPPGDYMVEIFNSSVRNPEGGWYTYFYDVKILTKTAAGGYFKYGEALELNAQQEAAPIRDSQAMGYYLAAGTRIQSDDPAIMDRAYQITAGCESDLDKTVAIHDWVCNNIYYNWDALNGREPYGDVSALGVLASRRSVCEGYANLTIALLRAVGVPARKVSGYALGVGTSGWPAGFFDGPPYASNHAWLEAWVNGRWIIIDPTWNSVNEYENGQVQDDGGLRDYLYFDISPEFFAFNHAATQSEYWQKASAAKERIYLYINNPMMQTSTEGWKNLDDRGTAPVIRNGRTLVPVALIVSQMGGVVTWDGNERKVSCDINGHFVEMWIDYAKYYIDAQEYTFDVAPQIINQRTMIPLRGLLEPLGCIIGWEANVDGWPGRVTIDYYK